ncbi:MAG: MarR family transcriptional regulator [Proteobacteria bacterium]|nr:MAG: MarR family transcriptional regulator [Pseudomonadota bacterium]
MSVSDKYAPGRRFLTLLKSNRELWRREADKAFATAGLSLATSSCFFTIARLGEGIRQITIAEDLGIKAPTLVRQLDILEENGLISRKDAPDDRRAKLVYLTPAGRKFSQKIDGIVMILIDQMMAGISAQDIERVNQLFDQIAANAETLLTTGEYSKE